MTKKLTKSRHKVFAGVLGGIAEYFNWDASLVRVIYVVLSFASTGFPGLLIYIILAMVLPEAPSDHTQTGHRQRREASDVYEETSKDNHSDWSDF